MKLSTDITKKEGHDEEEEIEKSTKVIKASDDKTERLNQLKQFLKAQLNIPEQTKGESLQQALQKVDATQLKQLVQQFNQMQNKTATFSTPTNVEEKENCHVPRAQPVKEVTGESKLKIQMKMLNDLLHKLAANKANGNACGPSSLQQMAKSQFLLKTKSFISPKKGKVSLLGKRSSFNQ
jgi:hypothetical protein